ncbi:MAG TPA: thioredoxin domain-containing protein [Pseudomonadota bacterium]|jgi:protein-disulfide isomerase|nr:thioredoxin domain-containing protein [Pseudomonadota bacterium]
MNKTGVILGTLGALIVGFLVGQRVHLDKDDSAKPVAAAVAPDASVERFKIQVGNASVTGSPTAKVTIIEFSDYQCPFCSRVEPTLEKLKRSYGKDLRVAFKHNPLPFHQNAAPASRAALAVREQGDDKFWAFHGKLFQNQDKLDDQHFEQFAQEVGANVDKWKADLAANKSKYDDQIQRDQAEASKFGARGTPAFFINGRPLSGAQPYDNFAKIVDEEIATATKLLKAGAKPEQLYASLIQNGKDQASGDKPAQQKAPEFKLPDPSIVFKVPVGNGPMVGPASAKVTIIEYSDFQCPFCSRVEGTLNQIRKNYGNDVRIAFKQLPLPFHNNAHIAAEASLAAHEQGKFWEMHDKLFANQQALDKDNLVKYASELGLDVGKFKAALESGKFKKAVDDENAEGNSFGARGTPSFFINGKPFHGAQPYENFEKVVQDEIKRANAKIQAGTSPDAIYAELTKDGKDKAEAPKPAPSAAPAEDKTVYKALVGDAPVKGPKDAKVTIVMWSDFQCPFCSRVEPTITQIMKDYPKEVRVAFKQLPLPFHNNAHIAAEAALAAHEQGKFWEMHDKMFQNQQALDRASLDKYAQELGLNMKKFAAALDSGKYKQKVDDELAEGNKIGANGTPAFFINGRSLSGAQPIEQFKSVIDGALKDVDAMLKGKKMPAAKIYDEIMKSAVEKAAAPPAGGGEEEDKTVYKVDPGEGPSFGPKNAPVTIVEFSDFQCPFCSRVVPTIKKIKETYGNKVRVVWRNYPLPFHQDAKPAAEAAMAAGAQGKFWEMHDKLFENQRALDRASLEKYAAEIGIDVSRFKADLDAGRYKAQVDGDFNYGNSLPGGGMGTPTFFINGRKIAGAYPFEKFDSMIKEALAAKK